MQRRLKPNYVPLSRQLIHPTFKGGARAIEGRIVSQQTDTIFELFVDTNGWCLHLTVRIFVQVLHIILQFLWGDALSITRNMQSKYSTADRRSSTKNLSLRFPDSFRTLAPETIIFCHLNIAQNLSLAGQTTV